MALDLVLDYFGGFGNILDTESMTTTFVYLNKLTYFVMKLIEKLKSGEDVAIMVDGPSGPNRKVKEVYIYSIYLDKEIMVNC